jgi:antitoxin ParD1/3/4
MKVICLFINKGKFLVINIKLISVNLPESYLNILEMLVSQGVFPNRSEAIRVAIRDLIKTEYLIEESIKKNIYPTILESDVKDEIRQDIIV